MYAAPAAGAFLAEHVGGLMLGMTPGLSDMSTSSEEIPELPDLSEEEFAEMTPEELDAYFEELTNATDGLGDDLGDDLTGELGQELDEATDELQETLQDFEGAAVSIRFDGGSVAVEMVGDPGMYGEGAYDGDGGAEALGTLPSDTMAAFGIGFEDGWFDEVLTAAAPSLGEDLETLLREMEEVTGLSLPEDAEALFGDSATLAVGGGMDPDELFSLEDPSTLPLALKVLGDADEVEGVLDKIRPQLGSEEELLGSSADGDAIVIGPNADFRDEVLGDGGLAGSDSFESVVPDADDVAAVLFLDLDKLASFITEGMGDDELADNLKPLDALGMSAWEDDGVSHARLRISTD
jgi:hypothetical protein